MPSLDPDLRALQEVRDAVERAHAAHEVVASWDQARIDGVCEALVRAAASAAYDLGKLAVEETGIGRVHYKVLKNVFAAEGTWESIKDEKTCGIIARDEARGLIEVATPAGVIAAIVPTTNPTSTAIFKALISVKGRNAVVISPHPRARRCIGESAEVMRRALERAGAPADLVIALSNPTIESTGALMSHPKTAMILATGGSGLVKAAYSSGKPAYGVGPGNVPAYIDRSADVRSAARWIISSQSFDNATLCCSEQNLILDRPIADSMLAEMQKRGAHLCCPEETEKLERLCNRGGHMNPDIVGIDPWRIAELAGFRVPRSTPVLLAKQDGVGREFPLSIELLCPLLSVNVVDGWEEGCKLSQATLHYGGLGHTLSLWARDEAVLDAWFLEKPANRIVVNGPTSEGAVGYSTNLMPSMSLGCGPQAGNITSDNITARHLINIKRVAFPRADWESRYEAGHRRASVMTGEAAPRGSGLPGDPALGAPAPAAVSDAALPSHWQGNPVVESGSGSGTARAKTPRFTQSQGGTAARTAVLPPRARKAKPAAASAPAGPYVGMSLTPDEIQGILAHAGQGCPLGPCRGCPHADVQSGACLA